VYALISRRMLSDNEDAATSGELPAAPRLSPTPLAAGAGSSPYINERDADETWPDDLLRRSYEESSPAMRAILDLMANEPARRSTTREFATAAGFEGERGYWSVPGVMGAYTRRAKNRYGHDLWPFAWKKLEDTSFLYWMPESIAAKVRVIRDGRTVELVR
jgi:Family of unknown function (DUF6416)